MNSKLKLALLSLVVLLSAAFSVHGFIPNDGDGDGVPDVCDACPNTPSGSITHPSGCPPASTLA